MNDEVSSNGAAAASSAAALNDNSSLNQLNGGEMLALNVVAGMYFRVEQLQMTDLLQLCQEALDASGGAVKPLPLPAGTIDKKTESQGTKRQDKRSSQDFFGRSMTFSYNQVKNQAMRFGQGGEGLPTTPRPSRGSFFGGLGGDKDDSRDYEDVVSQSVLQAPICDICIVPARETIPKDFYRLHKTPNNKKADLNLNSGGNPIYLCIRKDTAGQMAPITNIVVVFPDRNEYVPPGYVVVQTGSTACNINIGTHSERVYLCFKREMHGNPIVDLQLILPSKGEQIPKNFTMIEKSVTGASANLNSGCNGPEIFLCYRQQMNRLKCLGDEDPEMKEEESVLVSKLRMRRQTVTNGGAYLQSVDDTDVRLRSSSLLSYSPLGKGGGIAVPIDSPGKHRRSVTLNVSSPLKTIMSEDAMGSTKLGMKSNSASSDAQDSRRHHLRGDLHLASQSDDNVLRGTEKLRQVALHELRRSSTGLGSGDVAVSTESASPEAAAISLPIENNKKGCIDPLSGSTGIISVDSHDSESTSRSHSPRMRHAGDSSEHLSTRVTPIGTGDKPSAVALHKRDISSTASSCTDLLTHIKEDSVYNGDSENISEQAIVGGSTVIQCSPRHKRENSECSVADSLSSKNSSPRVSDFKSIHPPVQIGLNALGHQQQTGSNLRSSILVNSQSSSISSQPLVEPPPPLYSPFSPSVLKTVEGSAASATTGSAGIAVTNGSSSTSEYGASSSDATGTGGECISVRERKMSMASVGTGGSDDMRSHRLNEYGELYAEGGECVMDYEEEIALLQQLAHLSNQRKNSAVVNCYGLAPSAIARKSLRVILSALYIRQGGIANLALAGLCDLLRDSDFFSLDLECLPESGSLTMLDLTVEAVCDRFEVSADGERGPLLRFIGLLSLQFGKILSLLSLQRIFRSCIFLCNHYASYLPSYSDPKLAAVFDEDEEHFGDDYNGFVRGDLDSQEVTPFHALQKLIVDALKPSEDISIADRLPEEDCSRAVDGSARLSGTYLTLAGNMIGDDQLENPAGNYEINGSDISAAAGGNDQMISSIELPEISEHEITIGELVSDLIEDITDSIEVSRLTESAYITISKQSSSIISAPFWREIQLLAGRLFSEHAHRSAYMVLCGICKQSWHGVRTRKDNRLPIPRDLAGKLVALDALQFFLLSADENLRLSKVVGYQIRRLVVPCMFYNVSMAFLDHRIFSRMMRIVSGLWKRWRRHLRIEFAILCEQFIFKVMQANVIQIRPMYKRIVIHEVIHWFDQPHMLLEMFVNYDMDRKFVSTWNIFSYFVRVLCTIARRLIHSNVMMKEEQAGGGQQRRDRVSTPRASTPVYEEDTTFNAAIRDVHFQALEEVGRMAKTLMDASGHALLFTLDSNFRNKTQDMGWADDEDAGSTVAKALPGVAQENRVVEGDSCDFLLIQGDCPRPLNNLCNSRCSSYANGTRRVGSIRLRRAAHQESEALIQEAVEIYKKKDSLKKAVDFLIKKNFMAKTPHEIANFLRVYKHSFDEYAIGDFLGEGGKTDEEEFWAQIRFRYTRAVSFVEMDVEQALRLYLTGCGFKLPGEGQKVDRIVDAFSKAFWQDNSGTEFCPFRKPDEVHITAYAIIMLNTDLHKVNVGPKKKNRISKEAFYNMLRDYDLGKQYVSNLYDNVDAHPIEMEAGTKPSGDSVAGGTAVVGKELDSKFYTIQGVPPDSRQNEERNFQRELLRSLRDSEDTMRSLSARTYRFHFTNVDTKITLDLVSYMFESVWSHFHNTAEMLLFSPASDVQIKNLALEILLHSLTSAMFLELHMEKMTLAALLQRVRSSCEEANRSTNADGKLSSLTASFGRTVPDDSWYSDVENATPESAIEISSKLHVLMIYLKDLIQETMSYELTTQVARKFEAKFQVLEKNTFFVHHGDLIKINSSGKHVKYRFFLFSDYLYYAKLVRIEFRVHGQLPLLTMTLTDVADMPGECSFYVESSVKSFFVVAPSPRVKQHWLQLIGTTIASCKKRNTTATESIMKRRMSMFSRLEDQRNQQMEEMQESMRSPDRPEQRMSAQKSSRNIASGISVKDNLLQQNSTTSLGTNSSTRSMGFDTDVAASAESDDVHKERGSRKHSFGSPSRGADGTANKLRNLKSRGSNNDDDDEPVVRRVSYRDLHEAAALQKQSSHSSSRIFRPRGSILKSGASGEGIAERGSFTRSSGNFLRSSSLIPSTNSDRRSDRDDDGRGGDVPAGTENIDTVQMQQQKWHSPAESASVAAISAANGRASGEQLDFLASSSSDSAISSTPQSCQSKTSQLSPDAAFKSPVGSRKEHTSREVIASRTNEQLRSRYSARPLPVTPVKDNIAIDVKQQHSSPENADSDEDTVEYGDIEDLTHTDVENVFSDVDRSDSTARVKRRKSDTVRIFAESVIDLPPEQLRKLFNAGVEFWRRLDEKDLDRLSKSTGQRLFGLQKHVLAGAYDMNSVTSELQQQQWEAWRDCADLAPDQAQREFLCTLYTAVPQWNYLPHL